MKKSDQPVDAWLTDLDDLRADDIRELDTIVPGWRMAALALCVSYGDHGLTCHGESLLLTASIPCGLACGHSDWLLDSRHAYFSRHRRITIAEYFDRNLYLCKRPSSGREYTS